jgi:hypothetical protein
MSHLPPTSSFAPLGMSLTASSAVAQNLGTNRPADVENAAAAATRATHAPEASRSRMEEERDRICAAGAMIKNDDISADN